MIDEDRGFLEALGRELAAAGVPGPLGPPRALGGGCIHAATRIDAGDRPLFVKRGDPGDADAFAAEAEALEALAAPGAVRVPRPLVHGVIAGRACLVTEFVEMGASGDAGAFGADLARLHGATAAAFGWHRDNRIGSTPQPNGWHDDWVAFWRERRLGHQLDLAEADGQRDLAARGRRLAERLEDLFAGHAPAASILHGDLWAGNHGYDAAGRGCIFDPATYYGDREADLAMTELFGGFPAAFHDGYASVWPLEPGYATRKRLYNLYHLLNHAHLFGGGYVRRADATIKELLAELGG